jgi:hypothetical protein
VAVAAKAAPDNGAQEPSAPSPETADDKGAACHQPQVLYQSAARIVQLFSPLTSITLTCHFDCVSWFRVTIKMCANVVSVHSAC